MGSNPAGDTKLSKITLDKSYFVWYNNYIIEREEKEMSNLNNDVLMENLYEEALEMGLSEEVAEEWALEKFENTPTPFG